MGPDDCMSQDFFNSLNERGAISGSVYVCGWGWTLAGWSASGCGSGCGSSSSCLCGCCNYNLCSCINSGCGSGSGCGSSSGSDSGSGCGSSDSHTCACSCYYCGAYGCGAGSGCGCGELKNPIELMDSSKFVGFCTGVQCWDLCKEILDKYGISSYGGRTAVFRLVEEVSGSLANWGDSQNYQNAINSFLRLTG